MTRMQKFQGYLIAVAASCLVLALRYALQDVLGEQAALLPFVLAVVAAAWWGGLGPGLLATAVSATAGVYYIVPPPFSLRIETVEHGLNAAFFVAVGVLVSVLCEALHAAQRRETEKQFRTLADSMPQLAWMATPDGHRFWYNQRWFEYTGTNADQMEKYSWTSVHDTGQRSRVRDTWTAAMATGQPWEETVPLRRRDGAMRWHLCRALPLRNADGEIVRWFGTNTDISDRIELENALREADRRKDEFLATLAHELRNPLAPLSNALQLWAASDCDPQELDQLRAVMERQVQQMVRLIDDLMDVSRITRGKIQLDRQPLDLAVPVSRAIEANRPLIQNCGHQLHVEPPAAPVVVNGDVLRLTQTLGNILNNAAKYTGQHGQIWVGWQQQGREAVVTIRDDGPGIAPGTLAHVFDMFSQADSTLERSHGGLGIGLTLVKQLVELHEGTVEAHSEGLNRGSQFVVRLPALVGVPLRSPTAPELTPLASLPRHRVLVVDDHDESAETLAMLLQSLGQEAFRLNSGPAALEWILANRPEIVFLDVAMPGMNGYEVAERLRMHPELNDTLLVALTGYGTDEARRRAAHAGFNVYLTKPADPRDLEQLLTGRHAQLSIPVGTH